MKDVKMINGTEQFLEFLKYFEGERAKCNILSNKLSGILFGQVDFLDTRISKMTLQAIEFDRCIFNQCSFDLKNIKKNPINCNYWNCCFYCSADTDDISLFINYGCFAQCNFELCRFCSQQIIALIFKECTVEHCEFKRQHFLGGSFAGSTFKECNFSNSIIENVTLTEASFLDCDIDYAHLQYSCKTLGVHFDDKILIQQLYHLVRNVVDSKHAGKDIKKALLKLDILKIANKFNRLGINKNFAPKDLGLKVGDKVLRTRHIVGEKAIKDYVTVIKVGVLSYTLSDDRIVYKGDLIIRCYISGDGTHTKYSLPDD